MSDTATVKLIRKACFLALLNDFTLLSDGEPIGTIANGKEATLQIPAGHHALALRVKNKKYKTLEFDFSPGENRTFECGLAVDPWLYRGVCAVGLWIFFDSLANLLLQEIYPSFFELTRYVELSISAVGLIVTVAALVQMLKRGVYYLKDIS